MNLGSSLYLVAKFLLSLVGFVKMKSLSFPRFWREYWHGCQPPNERLQAHIWKTHIRQQCSKSFFFYNHSFGASMYSVVFLAQALKWFKVFCMWFIYVLSYSKTPKSCLQTLLKRWMWNFQRAKRLSIST